MNRANLLNDMTFIKYVFMLVITLHLVDLYLLELSENELADETRYFLRRWEIQLAYICFTLKKKD